MRPRTIFVKVSTELLSSMNEWSEPVQVRIERQPDDTYEMVFRKVESPDGSPSSPVETTPSSPHKEKELSDGC